LKILACQALQGYFILEGARGRNRAREELEGIEGIWLFKKNPLLEEFFKINAEFSSAWN